MAMNMHYYLRKNKCKFRPYFRIKFTKFCACVGSLPNIFAGQRFRPRVCRRYRFQIPTGRCAALSLFLLENSDFFIDGFPV